jgi:hypothetical protein
VEASSLITVNIPIGIALRRIDGPAGHRPRDEDPDRQDESDHNGGNRSCVRNSPNSLGGVCGIALRTAEKAPFNPFALLIAAKSMLDVGG